MKATLNDNIEKLNHLDKSITYEALSELYGLEEQELIDAVTMEHTLITKLTDSGMSFEQIRELADNGSANNDIVGQVSLFEEHSYKD